MKQRLAIILAVVALAGVIIMIALWIAGGMKLSVVSLDTFIGVSVAILSLLFTIVIGWQIVNALEVKNEMKALANQQKGLIENEKKLAENDRLHTKEAFNLQSAICQLTADSNRRQGLYTEAFVFLNISLYYAIMGGTPNQLNYIKQMKLALSQITTRPLIPFDGLLGIIIEYSDKIKQTESYRNCLSEIYDETMKEFWMKMRSFGLEMKQ